MNFLRARDGVNRQGGCWGEVGLGLVMLVVLAGASWAQEAAVEPDTQATAAVDKSDLLPQPVTEGPIFPALHRTVMSTTMADRTAVPIHLRYELKMVDYKGNPHTGTYEMWRSKDASHTEIHTDTYNWSDLTKDGKSWALESGVRPLRVKEFISHRLIPAMIMNGLTKLKPELKPKNVKGDTWMCGGENLTDSMCFEAATGYPTRAQRNDGKFEYEDWRQIDSLSLAGVVRMTNVNQLLFEARLTEASDVISPEAFSIPPGATLLPEGSRIELGEGIFPPAPNHPIMRKGTGLGMLNSTGEAQVKVWVNEKGKVTKEEVEDADDKDLAVTALQEARSTLYQPYLVNGSYVSFETTFNLSAAVGGSDRSPRRR